jgi:hypothetical protein
MVAAADTAGGDTHPDFALARVFEGDIFDLQRLLGLKKDCGLHNGISLCVKVISGSFSITMQLSG